MWNEEGFLELVISEQNWYYETYHKVNPKRYPRLPQLPIINKHGKLMCRITTKWITYNRKNFRLIRNIM